MLELKIQWSLNPLWMSWDSLDVKVCVFVCFRFTVSIDVEVLEEAELFVFLVLGFDAYLVGGCVRDLILNRVPKDYDVITTADLKQV